jgi:RNA polymerase sigma-70 factor (ECF subfamily)
MSNQEFGGLLAQARQGDPAALGALHSSLEEKMRKAARRRLGRVLRAYVGSMDIVQSAQKSLLICLRRGKYDISSPEQLMALAMRILHRKVAQKWRKVRQDLRLRDKLVRDRDSRAVASDGAPQSVENRELVDRLMQYMNKTERDLVQLLLQGETITSAANLLELNPAYARVLLSRMKTRLAALFNLPDGFP